MFHSHNAFGYLGFPATLLCVIFTLLVPMIPSSADSQADANGRDTCVISDAADFLLPSEVRPGGLLGERYFLSEKNRLLKVDEEELLGGFRNRPGTHPWIGEHVGKWLHSASLTY
ncbi:MAG TPA: hypothetical protein VGK34_09705, partial [Armatimonadota bacterium]